MNDAEYKAEYDKAAAELDAAAQATTARGPDGKFAKAEPAATPEPTPQPTPNPVKTETPAKEDKPEVKDELAEMRTRLEKAEKIALDNQRAFTKAAQEAAQLKREREQREREANKPPILDANPGLAEAIEFVARDPKPAQKQADQQQEFYNIVNKAHPGILDDSADKELVGAIVKRMDALPEQERGDPLVLIREITEEKLAFAERQLGKRFAAEAAKQSQKSAMSVPGAGGGSGVMTPVDAQLAEVQRIQGLSDADFAKEVRRAKGL